MQLWVNGSDLLHVKYELTTASPWLSLVTHMESLLSRIWQSENTHSQSADKHRHKCSVNLFFFGGGEFFVWKYVYQKIKIPEFYDICRKIFFRNFEGDGANAPPFPISYAYAYKSKFDMHKIYCQYCHRGKEVGYRLVN